MTDKARKKKPESRKYDYDFFVIGAGSGGMRAARVAAEHGVKVGLAEERYLGGTCVNAGCVPKKLLSYGSQFAQAFLEAAGYGWKTGKPKLDWKKLVTSKDAEISRLNDAYRKLIISKGVDLHEGHRAKFVDAHTIRIGNKTVTADKILISTGSWPAIPPIKGKEHGISSNEIFHLDKLPRRTLIVGGGYIGVEFAGILTGLGSKVTLVNRQDKVLNGFDDDIREAIGEEMVKQGVDLRANSGVTELRKTGTGIEAVMNDGSVEEFDTVLFATGRKPLTQGLDLQKAGVDTAADGAVKVNEDFQSSVKNIYAVGDVISKIMLTPVAITEAHALADKLFGNGKRQVDYDNIPSAVFATPPIGTVGLTEEKALDKYGDIDVYKTSFTPMKNTLSGNKGKVMMKLIVDRKSDRVVGAHMVGPDAPEIMQALAVAIKSGATKADFDATTAIHPTATEEFVLMSNPVRKTRKPRNQKPRAKGFS